MFLFDLQLFGHSGGKSGGKVAFTLLGGALGGIFPAVFGATKALAGAIMGASLMSGIWTATHAPDMDTASSPEVQRFDRAQETMSSDGLIPVVYGYRKITGNQTYHATNAEANQLHKHVVLCEGGIEGIVSVSANGLLIPTGEQTENTVFTITNTKYADARAWKDGKTLHLFANGVEHSVYLCNRNDASSDGTFYEWQTNTVSLIAYINKIGDGFEAFPMASTSKYPGDLYIQDRDGCYNHPVGVLASTVVGGTKYTFHDCEPPDSYEETGGYPKMAWLDMYFNSSAELNGNPSVDVILKGKKVYDSRTKETVYSTNPAMCLRDFLLSKRYGVGRWITAEQIDEDSFKEAADYCDQVIEFDNGDGTTTKAKRYELNMVIDQKQTAISWVQEILANFSAYLTYADGKYKLCVEKQTPVSYEFTDDGISNLSVSPVALDEAPNKYDVKIIDPKNDWKSVSCLVEDYADQKERGKIVTKEIQLNGTTSQHQALRLARFYRDYNLVCPLQFSFSTGLQAMHLQAGDVVTITYRNVWEKIPIRISEIREDENGKYEISGRQYNNTLYYDGLGGGIHWHNYTQGSTGNSKGITTPSSPRNLKVATQYRRNTDGKTIYELVVTFDLPKRYDTQTGLVYYKNNAISAKNIGVFKEGESPLDVGLNRDWIYAGESNGKLVIPNVKLGDIYVVRVITKATTGLTSDSNLAPETRIKVTAKKTVPAQPHNLRYDFTNAFHFEWDDVADSDVIYYEVRNNGSVGNTFGLLGRTTAPSIDVNLTERNGTIYVYAVNTQKKHSYPATCDWKYPKPDAPENIELSETPRGMNIKLPFFPAGIVKARLYITGVASSDVIDINNPVYEFKGNPSVYSIRACYVDRIGEGYVSNEFTFTINPTFNPEWIADESLSLEKMDGVIKDAVKDAQEAIPRLNDIDTDILKINGDITELQKSDGEIKSTITKTNKETQEKLASQLKQTADSINATVAANKKSQDGENAKLASQIKQTADEVKTTVQNNKKAADGSINGLSSQIKQQADRITSVITNLNNSDPSKAGYSAITQLLNGINLRVKKDDIINQINMTAVGTTIDGKYLHITGTTKIDNNVIVGGMIKAGAITADKLSTGTISLTGGQGIKGGAALLNANGMSVTTNSGSVSFDSQGMSFKDKNGQAFSVVGRFLTGVANEGQYVKFTKPWDVIPTVMLIPTTMQTGVASYSASNTYTKCYAENVSKDGFKVRCYSCLGAGSSGVVGINKRFSFSTSASSAGELSSNEWTYTGSRVASRDGYPLVIGTWNSNAQTFTLPIPNTATTATIKSTVKGYSYSKQSTHISESGSGATHKTWHWDYQKSSLKIEYLVNGTVTATDSYCPNSETAVTRSLSFAKGSTITARVSLVLESGHDSVVAYNSNQTWITGGTWFFLLETATVNTNAESVIAKGTAAFIVTDTANKQYTVT